MGLDMYLNARKYSYASQYNKDAKLLMEYPEELKDFEEDAEKDGVKECTVSFGIGYWRKFNALHTYIVDNFAEGVDDCKPVCLSYGDIEQIIDDIKEIMNNHDEALRIMPPTSGLFFGGDDIDDYYWEELEYSLELFEKVLLLKNNHYDIIYQASW